jgi:hypothetical protein
MYGCASMILRSAFAPSIRFLRSSSVSIYGTYLKWQYWRPRDLVVCSQTIIFGMRRSSLNVYSTENRASNSCFRITTLISSSGVLLDHESSPIETQPILNSWTQ